MKAITIHMKNQAPFYFLTVCLELVPNLTQPDQARQNGEHDLIPNGLTL